MAAEWTVLCDFDGTISRTDVIDSLLQSHGRAGWQQLEADWLAGRMGSRQCMQEQVALLDLDLKALHSHLDEIAIDPRFADFLALVTARGWSTAVVSDGLDYAIDYILRRHGIEDLPVYANRLAPGPSPVQWQLTSPFQQSGCGSGTCKCALVAAARDRDNAAVLLVGDGRSDFCAAQRADHVFAKARLREHCQLHRLPHTAIAGFADAIQRLPLLDSTSS